MKITNHHELRRDVSIDCSEPVLTDQSYKNACDINLIMANYAKTGMLPHFQTSQPQYIDNTEIPNLMEAFEITRHATDLFNQLPADVRRLMDNNPANLEEFVNNPENKDILLKNGVLVKREEPKTDPLLKKFDQLIDKLDTGGSHVKNDTVASKTA